jgi:hypothetical protein
MASSSNTISGSATGGRIALGKCLSPSPYKPLLTVIIGGIIFQFIALVVYMLLTIEFLTRYALKKPFSRREDTLNGPGLSVLDSKTKQMIFGVGLSSLAMFIR